MNFPFVLLLLLLKGMALRPGIACLTAAVPAQAAGHVCWLRMNAGMEEFACAASLRIVYHIVA